MQCKKMLKPLSLLKSEKELVVAYKKNVHAKLLILPDAASRWHYLSAEICSTAHLQPASLHNDLMHNDLYNIKIFSFLNRMLWKFHTPLPFLNTKCPVLSHPVISNVIFLDAFPGNGQPQPKKSIFSPAKKILVICPESSGIASQLAAAFLEPLFSKNSKTTALACNSIDTLRIKQKRYDGIVFSGCRLGQLFGEYPQSTIRLIGDSLAATGIVVFVESSEAVSNSIKNGYIEENELVPREARPLYESIPVEGVRSGEGPGELDRETTKTIAVSWNGFFRKAIKENQVVYKKNVAIRAAPVPPLFDVGEPRAPPILESGKAAINYQRKFNELQKKVGAIKKKLEKKEKFERNSIFFNKITQRYEGISANGKQILENLKEHEIKKKKKSRWLVLATFPLSKKRSNNN